MLSLDDTVLYGTTGVCVVASIEKKKIGKQTKEYYVLKPVSQSSSTVFIPTDNSVLLSKVRQIASAKEIRELIKNTTDSEWIEDEAERREAYARIVTSGDRAKQLSLMRTLRTKQRELSTKSKRLHISDERFLKEVSRIIVDEFSFVLGTSVKETEELIIG